MEKKTFASDNYSGVHPAVMDALLQANAGHAPSYGTDEYCETAVNKFKEYFGSDIDVFLVYNGTGANVLGLQALTRSFHSILCAELAHINVDESTAPEKFLGCKLVTVPAPDGKMSPGAIEEKIQRIGDQHHPQAKVVSLSQSTEYGTVYSVEELKAIGALAKKHNLYFHMDGSRISNAAVSLNRNFSELTRDAGVDVLSFGGTKNGMMFGEAVIVFNKDLGRDLKFLRKQAMQLHSKMRFIGAQFTALLSDDLWKKNAVHSNAMAKLLERELRRFRQVTITQPVDANGVFAIFPKEIIAALQEEHFFYVWNDRTTEVRLMCSFDTTEAEIKNFGRKIEALLASV
ncbi:MAG TPA: low specificity L-threonine aldolase [Chryseosolibacter sp.]